MKNQTLFSSIHNSECERNGNNLRGEYGESLAIVFFTQHGYRVAASNGDHYPYDLLVERHGATHRIQVKTTRNQTGPYYRSTFSTSDEWDAALIITELGEVYLIPRIAMVFENSRASQPGRSETRRFVLYPKYTMNYRVGKFRGFDSGATTGDVVSQLEGILLHADTRED